MNDRKATKRALFTSVMALVMCMVMLVGTTFAWFTDAASTSVNKIEAGKLDVQLVDKEGNDLTGTTLTWITKDNRAQSEIFWEPGCTYALQDVYVKNNGNLNLKYKIAITGIKGSAKLNKVIDWTINGIDLNTEYTLAPKAVSGPLTISGTMQTTANNDYQNETIDGIGITVYATQATGDFDSTKDNYDKDATYDQKAVFSVDTVNALKAAAENAKKGDEIILANDITLSETVRFSASGITFNGNGHTITAAMSDTQVENLATLLSFGYGTTYCTGVTVKDVTFAGKGGRAMHFHGGTSSLLENVKISGEWSLAINFYGTHGAVMNNCDISSNYANKYAAASIFANEQSANQIILNNTKIDSIFVNATEKGATYANNGIKLVVNSGSVVTELHTNIGITRTFHEVNGGTVGSVLADQ